MDKIHYIPEEYPEHAIVIIHLKNGGKTKGMFYWNGGKPNFASYGTNITELVIGWGYPTNYSNKEI